MTNKGQSTIEYLLLVTAVIAVLIILTVGTGKNNQSAFQNKLSNTVTMTMSGMETEAQKLTDSINK